jgi:predicted DNA-binding transcriptional regulator YafY
MLLPKSGSEFSNKQGTIKTFLHESQRIVEETNDTVLLEIYIHTTNDIIMELLKYGRNVKVVAPKSLVATMKERIAEMENLYK